MGKGKIVFYDNDSDYTDQFSKLMEDSGFKIELFTHIDALRDRLKDGKFMSDVKALIFDLAKDNQEASEMKNFAIISDIEEKFHSMRIPIFIHSAFAHTITNFDGCGTVWQIDKGGTSLEEITKIIEKLDQSGFLDAFTPGGIIEQSLFQDLHKSFTEQFRRGEIEKIIESFKKDPPDQYKSRLVNVFRRIAVRSLLSDLMIDRSIEDGYNEDTISAVEHYIRRINRDNVPVWTGDIFEAKDESHKIIILTPRCDVASKGKEDLLVCIISKAEDLTKKTALDFIRDNIKYKKYRYLPFTPLFAGGKVDFSIQKIISKEKLAEHFNYAVSLSDDLTNEILGKYCSYLLRTSIPEVDQKELEAFFK